MPSGSLKRGESILKVGGDENLAIAVAAANNHAAYAWWRAYGDAFHLNPYETGSIAVPSKWIEVAATRRRVVSLGRRLISAITQENIETHVTGIKKTKHESLNFHDCEPKTIAEIDALYIDALGLPREPLLTQLRELRSGSTWEVGMG